MAKILITNDVKMMFFYYQRIPPKNEIVSLFRETAAEHTYEPTTY